MKPFTIILIIALLLAGCSTPIKTVKDYPESPCYNPVLLRLQDKETLSADETKLLIQLMSDCNNHKSEIKKENDMNAIIDTWYNLAGIGAVVALFVYYFTFVLSK